MTKITNRSSHCELQQERGNLIKMNAGLLRFARKDEFSFDI